MNREESLRKMISELSGVLKEIRPTLEKIRTICLVSQLDKESRYDEPNSCKIKKLSYLVFLTPKKFGR